MSNQMNEWFAEYDLLLENVEVGETRLSTLKDYYNRKEIEIITKTDFKKIYGANNDKIRKQHIKTVLKNTSNDIKSLEQSLDANKRRISFLKRVIDYNIKLVDIIIKNDTAKGLNELDNRLAEINHTLKSFEF